MVRSLGLLFLLSELIAFAQTLDEGTNRFAAGWIGAMIGYWLC